MRKELVNYKIINKIMYQNIKIKSAVDKTTSTNKPYKACEVEDESGASFKVNIWSDFPDFSNLAVDSVVRAKLEQNGQYWNIKSETQDKPKGKPNMERVMEKKADMISVSQDKKAQNIAQAQDRSAWMWAKNNASMILANQKQEALNIRDLDEIAEMVVDLATKIYNAEPTMPF